MDLDTLITAADPARHTPLPGPGSPGASRLYRDITSDHGTARDHGTAWDHGRARRRGQTSRRPPGRPLPYPVSRWRLARPAITAVAVAAVAAGAVVVSQVTASPSTHPAVPSAAGPAIKPPGLLLTAALATQPPARAASAGLPRYFLTQDSAPPVVQLRDSVTGGTVAHTTLPGWADLKLSRIAAGPTSRSFVLALTSLRATRFYLLRMAPDGPARLVPLHVPPLPAGQAADSIALSPDGSSLAIAIQYSGNARHEGPGTVEVVQLASGATRRWPSSGPGTAWNLSWAAGGRTLAFQWDDSGPASGSARTSPPGLWELDTTAPGTGLLSGRRITPASVGGDQIQSAVLSPDGRTVLASVTYHGFAWVSRGTVVGGIVVLSARTGRPLRTLLTEYAHYSPDAHWHISACDLFAVDRTGQHLLVNCDGFGRLDRGRFTPLPGTFPVTGAAW